MKILKLLNKSGLRGYVRSIGFVVSMLFIGSLVRCAGAAAPTASLPLPSMSIGSSIQVPSATSSSVSSSFLTTGASKPGYLVTAGIPDGTLAQLFNLSRPLATGNNLVDAVRVTNGQANFNVSSGLIGDGDLLLIKAGSYMWNMFRFNASKLTTSDGRSTFDAGTTNIETSLSYQSVKDYWQDNGVDTSDITNINVSGEGFSALAVDFPCFGEFMERGFGQGYNARGVGGQMGTVAALFWAAYQDSSIDFASVQEEFFSSTSLSSSTASTLTSKASELLGISNTGFNSSWQTSSNTVISLRSFLTGVVASKDSNGTGTTFCQNINDDDSEGNFASKAVEVITKADDYSSLVTSYGSPTKIKTVTDIMNRFKDSTTGSFNFGNNFSSTVVNRFMDEFNETDNTASYDADTILDMMAYMPEKADGEDYNDTILDTWTRGMYEMFEDVTVSGRTWNNQLASTYWTIQTIGGGLTLDDDPKDIDFINLYDTFDSQYDPDTEIDGRRLTECIDHPEYCDDFYNAGVKDINDSDMTYNTAYVGGEFDDRSKCGNAICDTTDGENAYICPSDCVDDSNNTCGNGTCSSDESFSASCAEDCGQAYCGDGICDAFESSSTNVCAADCGDTGVGPLDIGGSYVVIPGGVGSGTDCYSGSGIYFGEWYYDTYNSPNWMHHPQTIKPVPGSSSEFYLTGLPNDPSDQNVLTGRRIFVYSQSDCVAKFVDKVTVSGSSFQLESIDCSIGTDANGHITRIDIEGFFYSDPNNPSNDIDTDCDLRIQP